MGGSSDADNRSRQGSAIGSAIGYASGGLQTDTESARLSNVQTYKFNSGNRNNKSGQYANSLNIRKINPNTVMLKPVSRASMGGGTLALSRASNPLNSINGQIS